MSRRSNVRRRVHPFFDEVVEDYQEEVFREKGTRPSFPEVTRFIGKVFQESKVRKKDDDERRSRIL